MMYEIFLKHDIVEILRSMLYRGSDMIRDIEWVIFDEVHCKSILHFFLFYYLSSSSTSALSSPSSPFFFTVIV